MNIDELKNHDVIYFSASFCAPCKVSKPIVEEVSNEKNIKTVFFTVNTEENGDEVSSHFNIKSVPTIVFLKENVEQFRHVGSLNAQKFTELCDTHL